MRTSPLLLSLFMTACLFPLTASSTEPPLERSEALAFCNRELARHIGAAETRARTGHCTCVVDFALDSTPQALRDSLARIVRRQPLEQSHRQTLESEAGNTLLYLGLVGSRCPMIIEDPLIQSLIWQELRKN